MSPKTLFVIVIVPMFAIAFILRIVFSFVPPSRPDLIPPADGLIESTTAADAQSHTEMIISVPSNLLGGEIYKIGTYTRPTGSIPSGTVIVNVVKEGQRFVEIVERPSTALPDVLNDYHPIASIPANLGGTTGTLMTLPSKHVACVSPSPKWDLPGFCEISRVLAFEKDGVIIAIGADGTHATDGELITMAKDILAQ